MGIGIGRFVPSVTVDHPRGSVSLAVGRGGLLLFKVGGTSSWQGCLATDSDEDSAAIWGQVPKAALRFQKGKT